MGLDDPHPQQTVGRRQRDAVVDAGRQLGRRSGDDRDPAAAAGRDLDQVGQVVLARRGRRHVADVGSQPGGVEAVGADIHLAAGAGGFIGVPFLDHRARCAVGTAHHAAVATRIGDVGGEQGDGRLPLGLLAQQALEKLRWQQRDVAHGHQHMPGAGRDPAEAGAHRVGGTELRVLANGGDAVSERGLQLVSAESGHHHRMLDAGSRQRGQHMVQHRPAGERVEDLGDARSHASPLAGGQDDGRSS